MFTVGITIAVWIIVRLVVSGLSEQRTIVPLLQLDRIGAAFFGNTKHFFGRFQFALMVMSDLSDHITITIVLYDFTV